MSKLIWRHGEKPTGPYKSFQTRRWPSAFHHRADGPVAVHLLSEENVSYHVSIADSTKLLVRVADHRKSPWTWRQLKARPLGLDEAKTLVKKFFEANPDWVPKE